MLQVFDDFLTDPDTVRESAIASGFGSWKPTKGAIGSSVYEGMNFYGDHATILETIYKKAGFVGFPNSMLFRITNEATERAYVHSDVTSGDTTCILYLSQHADRYGTGFYRHRESGLLFMPPLQELAKYPDIFEKLKADINDSGEEDLGRSRVRTRRKVQPRRSFQEPSMAPTIPGTRFWNR